MAGPFPGMDPYLEHPANWYDFHHTFIHACRGALRKLLPGHYTARINERVNLVEGMPFGKHLVSPDVAVERQPGPARATTEVATEVGCPTVTLPLLVIDEPIETYIEILHRPDRALVTSIELLSPSNKKETGYSIYLTKRNALLFQKVNLVEFDLLLGGKRLPLRAPLPAGDYYAFVARADQRPDCGVHVWSLTDPLPLVRIPLRAPDPDVVLDLGAVVADAYEHGDYQREIDYAAPPPVALDEERMRWVAERLQPGPS